MIYLLAFLVFVVPIFLAVFLTSSVSSTVKVIGTGVLIVAVIVIPSLAILFGFS